MNVLHWLLLGVLDIGVALFALGVYYESRGQIAMLVRFRRLSGESPCPPLTRRPRWLSTQPRPNPDAIPGILAQAMGPFPMTPYGGDWNFFCYVHIDPQRPVRVRGQRVTCRHANLTLYFPEHLRGEQMDLPPNLDAQDLVCEADGSYEVIIKHGASDAHNRLDPGLKRHAILALRHYVFERGADIHYPEIWWGKDLVVPARLVPEVQSIFPREGGLRQIGPQRRSL